MIVDHILITGSSTSTSTSGRGRGQRASPGRGI